MEELVLVLVLVLVLLDSGVCPLELPDIHDRTFMEECVREHNAARSSASPLASDMLYMSWDEDLAVTARAWARRCRFQHNPQRAHPAFSSVGENLWTGAPLATFTVKKAIGRWVDERPDYDYQHNTCSNVCGHYTQVMWASSYKVGCAVQVCPNDVEDFTEKEAAAIFVCNYAPGGNVNGRRPFKSDGAPCSGCSGNCEDNLCRNKERDAQKNIDRDPSSTSSLARSSGFIVIATVRPIALIFTFIAAYTVHYFYPDIFCYQ